MAESQVGTKLQSDYFDLLGGLNTSDSPLYVKPNQSAGGFNYEYINAGAILKSLAPSKINTVANAQLKTLGLNLRFTKSNVKSIIRFAGTKIQTVDLAGTFTNLTEDTTAVNSTFLSSSSTQPVVSVMVTSVDSDVLWAAGGGMGAGKLEGVYSDSKVTQNGAATPTGSISATRAADSGSFVTTGTYFYAVSLRKASTLVESNAALDVSATVTSVTDQVTIDLSTITAFDTTKYDKILLYRSSVGGVEGFTAGDLVATINSTATSYVDTGTSEDESVPVPRVDSTVLDNSVLDPTGVYNTLTLFKRRLVTASESTVYLSEINRFESWPTGNTVTVPSGGPITGLAIISFTTPSATTTDEFLAVFKETELWLITLTGDDIDTLTLKFVDVAGSLGQSTIAAANGYLYFIDYRGMYIWDGAGKPYLISDPIKNMFGVDGTLDRRAISMGASVFFKQQNEVIWFLSDGIVGAQTYMLKLDLNQTIPRVPNTLGQRQLPGVFIQGKVSNPVYAAASFNFNTSASQEEVLITGDDTGFVYRQFFSSTGVGSADVDFSYVTPYLNCGRSAVDKKFHQVLVYVDNIGDWALTLDYWTNFKNSETDFNTVAATINNFNSGSEALWDVALWDVALWDGFVSRPKILVFNLRAAAFNNSDGDVIKLRFKNSGSDEPIQIHGFSIIYSEIGLRKQ